MEKFRKLGIIEPILKSIQEQNFEKPSEIQEKSIPLILEGKDVIAEASTGSGKTLAFASVIIKEVERGKGIQALILTPTRELAEQVSNALQRFSKHKHLETTAVYGGVPINPQMRDLRAADIVVGTPGRILDHVSRRTISFRDVKILVLDEADRMLDMGFKDDVERIIKECPSKRQTLLFSATISDDIARLAGKYMHKPVEVSAEAYVDPSKLMQVYYDVEDYNKFSLLVHFLKHEKSDLVMVFCNTQRNTDFIADNLKEAGIDALAIHGGHAQQKRTRTLEKFHSKHTSVLVCTDVAARGLDIKGVSHIYNYDAPRDSKDYIHRIGRTARAGKEGKVINIIASRDYENFQRIMHNDEFKIKRGETPQIERVMARFKEPRAGGFGRGFNSGRGGRFEKGFSRGREQYSREGRYRENDARSRPYRERENRAEGYRPRREFGHGGNFRRRSEGSGEHRENKPYQRGDDSRRSEHGSENRTGRFHSKDDRSGGNRRFRRSRNFGGRR